MTSREKFEAWMTAEQWFHGSDFEWDERRNCYAQFGIHLAYKAFMAAEGAAEQNLTDMAVQLANAESKCRELQRDNDSLEAVAVSMRDDMRDAREKLEELDNALCELLPGTQYMDLPDGGSVTPLEQVRRMVADYRERIEELESRTVIISRPKIGRLHGALLHLWPEYDVRAAVEHAGIKFKVED